MTDLSQLTRLPAARAASPAASGRARLRRLGAPLLAAAVAVSLTACGATGPGADASPDETTASALATDDQASLASECADVQATIAAMEGRLNALPEKIPSDLPGAIADVQTSLSEIQSLSERVQDGELKQHLDNVIGHGNTALSILEQARAGEITLLDAGARGLAELGELQADLAALSDYCRGA